MTFNKAGPLLVGFLWCFNHDYCDYFQVVRTGSVTEMKDASGEKRKAVVFKHDPDKGAVTVIDVKSRKRKTVGSLQPCYFRNAVCLYSLIEIGKATVLFSYQHQ